MQIAITDITRFSNGTIVCTAGIDLETRRCVRPVLPNYIPTSRIIDENIRVGDILLSNQMVPTANATIPHIEDHTYNQPLIHQGPLERDAFDDILVHSLSLSVNAGFDNKIQENEKYIPINTPPFKSLITVRAENVQLVDDAYKPGKIRVIFTDASGVRYPYISLTDFWLLRDIDNGDQSLQNINSRLRNSRTILRVGIGRPFEPVQGKNGYWLQVNSIITI